MQQRRENGDFVKACEVFWGEWLSVEDVELVEQETPESILLDKDRIDSLPKECRTLIGIIMNLPEEMYLVNGRLKRTFFRKHVKSVTGWSIEKVDRVQSKLESNLSVQLVQ
jgi:hypothetical protein